MEENCKQMDNDTKYECRGTTSRSTNCQTLNGYSAANGTSHAK